ncbi:Lrp/AsnC family transcriptional regulator [Tersicoccus sp. Bi-70]|uniref:Lrp/AsnC family transcriptional regulator n=1 Tax=Tersicoccus sp. Bi-70 TaxID=1897634 RepID=UPI0009FAB78A|nr:Lrp/AsnC family transcriptional regulator [Tersicoccus sp. Bi-70]
MTQVEIARKLGVSQPEVHRMLRKVDHFPELLDRTPREVILDFHAELINHSEMMDELKVWPFTFSTPAEPKNPLSPSARGSWEDVVDAVHRDLLLVEDYDELLHGLPGGRR